MKNDFAENSIAAYLSVLASAAPSPGGGSAAALSAAIGVALIEKVIVINLKKRTATAEEEKYLQVIRSIRATLSSLITKDKEVFEKLSRFKKEDRASRAYQNALREAAKVPVEICELCCHAVEIGAKETGHTGKWLYSDLLEAAHLLEASLHSARLTAENNLGAIPAPDERRDLEHVLKVCEPRFEEYRDLMTASVIHTLKPTVILDGKALAAGYSETLQTEIARSKNEKNPLTLASFRIGDAKDALFYSKSIARLLSALDIRHKEFTFAENADERDIVGKITAANNDPLIHGVLVFAPIPPRFHQPNLINSISPEKDVEGRGILTGFGERIVSPTANAVITLIESTQTDIAGKHAVIIGHSDLVGKPVSILLLDRYATVTVCHIKTKDLEAQVRKADIVVSAAGKAGLVKGKWIKPGAIVIDVGENVVNGSVAGDVEFDAASRRASHITPVPGGVGPVTNVMLVRNLIKLREIQEKRHALSQGKK